MIQLGQKIKKLRELKNYTQKYMASRLQMTQGNYARIESGEIHISDERLDLIAEILECSTDNIQTLDINTLFSKQQIEENTTTVLAPNGQDTPPIHYIISPELKSLYEDRISLLMDYIEELKTEIKRLQAS